MSFILYALEILHGVRLFVNAASGGRYIPEAAEGSSAFRPRKRPHPDTAEALFVYKGPNTLIRAVARVRGTTVARRWAIPRR